MDDVVSYLYPVGCGNDADAGRLSELLGVWQSLDDAGQSELLDHAKAIREGGE